MYIKPIQYRQFLPYGITIRSTDVLEKLTDYRYCLKICHDKDTRQLEAYDQPVYIEPADGIAMLVVQGAQTEAFLFARPVSINPGVYYCVLPYGCRESSYHEYTLGDRHCLPFDPTPYIYLRIYVLALRISTPFSILKKRRTTFLSVKSTPFGS